MEERCNNHLSLSNYHLCVNLGFISIDFSPLRMDHFVVLVIVLLETPDIVNFVFGGTDYFWIYKNILELFLRGFSCLMQIYSSLSLF